MYCAFPSVLGEYGTNIEFQYIGIIMKGSHLYTPTAIWWTFNSVSVQLVNRYGHHMAMSVVELKCPLYI